MNNINIMVMVIIIMKIFANGGIETCLKADIKDIKSYV